MNIIEKYDELVAAQKAATLQERSAACDFFRQNGFLCDAIYFGQKLVNEFPYLAALHANLAASYVSASQYRNASMHFSRALQLSNRQKVHLRNYAINCADCGEIDAARIALEEIISFDPRDAQTIRLLCARVRDLNPAWILSLINEAKNEVLESKDMSELLWAEYSIYEREGEFSDAYACLAEANRIKFNLSGYCIKSQVSSFERVKEVFSSGAILNYRRIEGGDLVSDSLSPLFICGMPRSGSTILEKVLEHYFDIPTVGEVETAASSMHSIRIGVQASRALEDLRKYYVTGLRGLIPAQKYCFVDKSLFNIRYLGFLLLAFPNARAIITRRDRNDIVWSNFRQYFSGSELGYSFDLEATSAYFKLVESYSEFWADIFPGRIMVVENSDLVKDPVVVAEEIKKNFSLGLEFKTKQKFVKPKTPSSTASSGQIHDGLRFESGSYRNYLEFVPSGVFHD
jgi:tetratricopeptide (TPR) repeat protein